MPAPSSNAALLVDYGGVLTTDIWSSFAAFCNERGLDPEAVKQLFRGDAEAMKALRGLETGEMSPADFEVRFGELLDTDSEGLIDGLFAGLQPVELMMEAVRRARAAGIPTGLISNSWVMEHYTDDVRGIFDTVVISGEVGLHKPEPEIYRLAAERLGMSTSDCIFVDDLRENCAGAEAVGMTSILHRDPEATVDALQKLLGVELR